MKQLTVRQERVPSKLEGLMPLLESFLLSQDVRQGSRRTYKRSLRQFVEWLTREKIQNSTRETILAYKGHLEAQGLSSLTLSNYLVAVRKFFEWTEGIKLYPNVARGVKGAKQSRSFRKDPLTVDQAKELLVSVPRSTLQGKRNFALLNLMVRTGLRTIEIVRANVGDIRQEGGEAVLWIQGKGRDAKDEFVLLTKDTLKPIRVYLRARGDTGDKSPLFTSLSNRNKNKRLTTRSVSGIVKQLLRSMGLDSGRLTAHSLRHTSITLALQGGATIQEAQALGRHANINTTLIYAHNINRIAHAPERRIDAVLSRTG